MSSGVGIAVAGSRSIGADVGDAAITCKVGDGDGSTWATTTVVAVGCGACVISTFSCVGSWVEVAALHTLTLSPVPRRFRRAIGPLTASDELDVE